MKIQRYYIEIFATFLCLTLVMLSGNKAPLDNWYLELNKPFFQPPSWIFGPVWVVLYITLGVILGKLLRGENITLIVLFILQFICNLAWSPLFFSFHRVDLALMDIFLLWFLVFVFIFIARNNKTIFILTLPYFLWISFAMVLNFSIYILNFT